MKLDFFKMHTQGNDYIYFDFTETKTPKIDFSKLAIKLCKRHFSIGSDGIVLILKDDDSEAFMKIFNADGSEGKMCGSALMCVSSYLGKKLAKKTLNIDTISGVRTGLILDKNFNEIKINMGSPEIISREPLTVENFSGYLIQIGNKHFVTFIQNLSADIAAKFGPFIEDNKSFPDGINVEFVKIKAKNSIEMRVWERGSGATLSCGTGACASVYAGIQYDLLSNNVKVKLPGGEVSVEYENEEIFLTGIVFSVFTGIVEV
jgi:diaminopimelate epimerase